MFHALRGAQPLFHALLGVKTWSAYRRREQRQAGAVRELREGVQRLHERRRGQRRELRSEQRARQRREQCRVGVVHLIRAAWPFSTATESAIDVSDT